MWCSDLCEIKPGEVLPGLQQEEAKDKGGGKAKGALCFSTHLGLQKPLQNQAFFAPEMKGEYSCLARCEIGGMEEENKTTGGMQTQRNDNKCDWRGSRLFQRYCRYAYTHSS